MQSSVCSELGLEAQRDKVIDWMYVELLLNKSIYIPLLFPNTPCPMFLAQCSVRTLVLSINDRCGVCGPLPHGDQYHSDALRRNQAIRMFTHVTLATCSSLNRFTLCWKCSYYGILRHGHCTVGDNFYSIPVAPLFPGKETNVMPNMPQSINSSFLADIPVQLCDILLSVL